MKDDVRLIDANAVSRTLRNLPFGYAKSFAGQAALKEIENAPTIDAVLVVHGRWLPGVPITCSLCGNPAAEHGSATVFWLSPYCPWCGQPMDAKEVEADGQEGT